MISKEIIDEIFSISNIVDVIGEFINLKKIGNNYKGLSPFSNERIPSLIVSPSKKIWKDFSSGKGGNVITFLMEYEKLSYPETLHWLANKYNISIDKNNENILILSEKKKLYEIQKIAKNFFIKQLNNTEEGINIGLDFLKKRNFKKNIIEIFELGYASKEWITFTKFALTKGYNYDFLQKSGLTIINKNTYDRYRNSIIFPINNINGIVIGFGGKIIFNKQNEKYKYINSPESLIYYKSKSLYGIFQAKKYIIKENFCYLVEGYTDVLSLYQTGIKNVVASLGTSLSKDQVLLIKKLTTNVVILYDGDLAGLKGSLRIIDVLLENNMDIKIINIGNNDDPDSICNKYEFNYFNVNNFIKKNIYNFVRFKIKLLSEEERKDITKKEKLIKNIIKSISVINNNIKQELYIQEVSNLLYIDKKLIYNELKYIIDKKNLFCNKQFFKEKKKFRYNIISPLIIIEETIINFILIYGNKKIKYLKNKKLIESSVIEKTLYHFNINNINFTLIFYQNIFNKIQEQFKKNKYLPDNIKNNILSDLSKNKYIYNYSKEINIENSLDEILLRHKSYYISNMITHLINKSLEDDTEKNTIKIREKILSLTKLKIEINKKLNRYV